MIVLIIVLLLIAFAFLLNAMYKRTNAYRNQFIDVRKFSVKGGVGDNLEIVNLGSTHPKFGFDYTDLELRGENWAVGPQTFEYDFAILRNYAHCLNSGAVVVIPVCLLSFFLYRQKSRAIHTKYYSFLQPDEIIEYNIFEKLSNYSLPLFFHPNRITAFIKDAKKDNSISLVSNKCQTDEELKKDAENWEINWERELSINIPTPTLLPQHRNDILQNIRILKDMIEFCIARGLKPVIVILPVTDFLYFRFSPEFIEKYILGYIADANKAGVTVMNYLTDKRFTDPSLYINSFFFNANGRKKFTKQFVEDLRAQSIL